MKNILVLDVAASTGGAVTILKQYYDVFVQDKENNYFVCLGNLDELSSTSTVNIIRFPWVKKSWFHRLWFDFFYAHTLLKKYNINEIFSLQNTVLSRTKLKQVLYLHQPLPFCGVKFGLFKTPKFWIYQNIIDKLIKKSAIKADKVIVQTQWMKQALLSSCRIDANKISVIQPNCNVVVDKYFDINNWENKFFYPASNFRYKNHILIFKAIKMLKDLGKSNFKVILTLNEDTLPIDCKSFYNQISECIELVGDMPHNKVIKMYSKSILLFPSYIETFGLPLLEARNCKAPIIASEMPFSKEILDNYDKADFFDPFDADALKNHMLKYIRLN